ncbi:cell division [Cyclospora cayetanensis]|uniref:Cell division n=1 Tax=Cyclospora cayetanensis TaxID=88456 RepID=A0A1D3D2N5_9EIME|nr:cell division [Cyclospora cayetanensis]
MGPPGGPPPSTGLQPPNETPDEAPRQQPEPPPVKTQKFKALRFKDLAGMPEAKQELQEVVDCLKAPQKFKRLGARLPRGLLLVGPPGTGKTALARAVATEAGVPLLYASGSEFVEVFVGQGARRVRQLFAAARKGAPVILFIDELDAVGGKRGPGGSAGGGREHEQTLNQLLVEMDGFQGGRFDRIVHVPLPDRRARELILLKYLSKVPVQAEEDAAVLDAGTTAREEDLSGKPGKEKPRGVSQRRKQGDAAEARVLAPTAADGESSSKAGPKSSSGTGEIEGEGEGAIHRALASQLAKLTPGFSGAELENLVNEAAILAARAADAPSSPKGTASRGFLEGPRWDIVAGRVMALGSGEGLAVFVSSDKTYISLPEFLEARDKVTLGPARGSRLQSSLHRRQTATHEAGHAVVAFFLQPSADPIHKATIVSRGSALGLVEQLPLEDRYGASFGELYARLCVCMGGRAAERLAFGHDAVTTGASSDIHTATQLAMKMVTSWGMSKQMGPLAYTAAARNNFLSSETARQIETEVKALVTQAEADAEALLRRHWGSLCALTEALLERETLSGEEIAALLDPKGTWKHEVDTQRQLTLIKAEERTRASWGPLWAAPRAWIRTLWHRIKRAMQRASHSKVPPDEVPPPQEAPPDDESVAADPTEVGSLEAEKSASLQQLHRRLLHQRQLAYNQDSSSQSSHKSVGPVDIPKEPAAARVEVGAPVKADPWKCVQNFPTEVLPHAVWRQAVGAKLEESQSVKGEGGMPSPFKH